MRETIKETLATIFSPSSNEYGIVFIIFYKGILLTID